MVSRPYLINFHEFFFPTFSEKLHYSTFFCNLTFHKKTFPWKYKNLSSVQCTCYVYKQFHPIKNILVKVDPSRATKPK